MHFSIFICIFLISGAALFGQNSNVDSLRSVFNESKDFHTKRDALVKISEIFVDRFELDSAIWYSRKVVGFLPNLSDPGSLDSLDIKILVGLGSLYQFYNLDSAIILSTKALEGSRIIRFRKGEAWASKSLGENYRLNGDYPLALENFLNALHISKEIFDLDNENQTKIYIGITYNMLGEYRTGLDYLFEGLVNKRAIFYTPMIPFAYSNIGDAYLNFNMLDSSLYFQEKALFLTDSLGYNNSPLHSDVLIGLGKVYAKMGENEKAMGYYKEAVKIGDYLNQGVIQYWLADLFHNLGQQDSSLHYTRLSYNNNKHSFQKTWIMDASRLLSKLYTELGMIDSAFLYQGITLAYRDSLYSPENYKNLQLTAVKEQQLQFENLQREERAEQERKALTNKIWVFSLLAVLTVVFLIALILLRNNRQKQKANVLLHAQKEEINLQREKAEKTLIELKSTQAQLIQSEKMASLGQLTAGIAHEIQNPLNFVNNFSEVSSELILEIQDARARRQDASLKIQEPRAENQKSTDGEELEDEILEDIKQNIEKINHHGKRADSIVKGMLEHSRASSGEEVPTDINALSDEYLRLSYHGLRAKDKDFNADYITDFDPNLPKVNVVPQEIGRVLLNIINNAFQACAQKDLSGFQNLTGLNPLVTVTTKNLGDKIEISIKDNGPGIPDSIKDKIFQPFFTTKPTGKGTGLGLSLSYDIVKAHGGEIRLETKDGEGSIFRIHIPINK